MENAKFIEDDESSGSAQPRIIVFEEESVDILLINTKSDEVITFVIVQDADADHQIIPELPPTNTDELEQPQLEVPTLRKSTREKRSTISDDFIVYLQEY